jgi:hypothetical protein
MTAPDALAGYGSSVDTSTELNAGPLASGPRGPAPTFRNGSDSWSERSATSGPSLRTLDDLTTTGSRRRHRSGTGDRKRNENGSGTDWEERVEAPDGNEKVCGGRQSQLGDRHQGENGARADRERTARRGLGRTLDTWHRPYAVRNRYGPDTKRADTPSQVGGSCTPRQR